MSQGGTFTVAKDQVTPSLNWPLIIGLIPLAIAIIGIAAALYIEKAQWLVAARHFSPSTIYKKF